MAKLEDLGEVITTDVLIVGGGIGGLVAAIKAKEESPGVEVLLVDKQTIGWAGKATKVGAIISLLGPEDDANKFVGFHVRNAGAYLNDQELLFSYVRNSYRSVEELAEWGVNIPKNAEGKIAIKKSFFAPSDWSMAGIDIDMMFPLRAKARKMGAKIMNKIQVVDLLKEGDRVMGAVGFNIIDGRFHIFKAKATLLANGSCNYKVRRFWAAASGDGIATAYRAGAEMRNAEFGNLYAHIVWKDTDSGFLDSNYLVNALGESVSKRYVPEQGPTGVFLSVPLIIGMEKEINDGRGPLYIDLSQLPPGEEGLIGGWNLPKVKEWYRRIEEKERKYGASRVGRTEVEFPLHGELSCIRVDHEMKTSLHGLWAIGDAGYGGAALAGAAPAPPGVTPGCGLGYAIISAMWGGPPAARFAAKTATPTVNTAEVKRLKEIIFAPMKRKKGLPPVDAIYLIQDVISPIKYNLRRSKDRLESAISKIKEVQDRLPELYAKDGHGLGKCHEAKAMAVCAELTFRAALMRTESRGMHYREDYPKRDNENWLKWVIIKQEAEKMVLSTEPVPIDRYKIKP